MKKSLIALAALAAVSAASAQSTVTIYGRMDLGFSKETAKVGQGTSTTTKTSSLAGAEGQRTSARVGFTGSEDLGGGLKAGFNIETNVAADAETQMFGTTRLANLNLSGGFGTVVIGTFLNSIDAVRGFSAGTASSGNAGGDFFDKQSDAALTGLLSGTLASARLNSTGRSSNAVAYSSPSFGGFTFGGGFVDESTKAATTTSAQQYLLTAAYAAGPLSARVAVANSEFKNPVTTVFAHGSSEASGTAFAVRYDLGIAVPYMIYETVEAKALTTTAGAAITTANVNKSSSTELGARFPMGALTPYILVNRGTLKRNIGGVNNDKTSAYQVGTTYDLSKRTYFYAAAGKYTEKAEDTGAKNTTNGTRVGLVHSF